MRKLKKKAKIAPSKTEAEEAQEVEKDMDELTPGASRVVDVTLDAGCVIRS